MKMDKKIISNNLLWRFFERCGAQGVTFIVSIVLARLLEPEVYGTVAIVTVLISIVNVFVDSGLGNSLIQKKDTDDLDYSTVFFFNIFMCLFLYTLLFFLAPFIADFYDEPSLTPIMRVLSTTIIISSVKNVQIAYVSKNMIFKKFFFATLGGTIGAAIIGIVMAVKGYGVWAIVAQNIFNTFVDTIILWITVKWRPQFAFSFSRLKELFSFGWKLLAASLIDTVYNDVRQLIIGKFYSSADLAYYNRGKAIPNTISTNVVPTINSVMLPSLSSVQNDKVRIKSMTKRAMKISAFVIAPIMTGMAVCSETFVSVMLTDKWLPAVFFLRIFCFSYNMIPIAATNLNAIQAVGRSDIFLKLEVLKKIIGIISILITMLISVKAMAISLLITSILSLLINMFPSKKLFDYSAKEQIGDLLPIFVASLMMGVIVFVIGFLPIPNVILLLLQIVTGVLLYPILCKVLKIDSLQYFISIVKEYMPIKEGKRR